MEIEYCLACEELQNWRELSNACEVDGTAPFVGTLVPDCSLPASIVEDSECSHAT